jgi:hypothetical protein
MSAEAGPSKIVDHLPVNPIPEGDVEMTRQDIEDLQDVVHELKMKWSGKSVSRFDCVDGKKGCAGV